ncbi:discoidin domain-containing protein [Intrasporangium sp. YIM S08009]|uniref:discoidin domain-containing protein n=1 Tax=Intrasporangium zincisolvens TaxID=3080018 RepID=UPI002B05D15F|nr:discoidin domain-containing protein [Intrasporangium sp. YIM S08009]
MTTVVTSRRRFLGLLGAGGVAVCLPLAEASPASALGAPTPLAAPAGWLDADAVAQTYHRALLRHTRWSETQWDATAGHYRTTDFGFAVVLGHAVLLTRGGFDADEAGIDEATLRSRTIASLKYFAGANRVVGGTAWGKTLFFDTTFQLYVQLAARLLWDELDEQTRDTYQTIAVGQAAYTTSLGTGNDPASGSWTPNGLKGGWVGDTKLEEMGVYAQSIAPGLAWASDDARWDDWFAAYGRWSRNEGSLPQADAANPAVVDGIPVLMNTAHNVYDTFVVENHGSFGPHYQSEMWRTSGRNSVHFLVAGRPLPEVLTAQPNGDALWSRLVGFMSDSGEPLMPLVDDREHLYGRDVIPLAFLAQVLGDRAAARSEADLADRLLPYLDYAPQYRLTKFSGEPKYEPEARAEVAISFLLHEWRAARGGAPEPLTSAELYAAGTGAVDLGEGPGIVSHQSPKAWAGAVSKPGFVKLAWQPDHDDWFFNLGGTSPMYLPRTDLGVTARSARTYVAARDGYDASVTVLTLGSAGRVALATLPGGEVVMTSSGVADREGTFGLHNLTMPGVRGLDGSRTFVTADGTLEAKAADAQGGLPSGVARRDVVDVPGSVTARYVRMLGVTPDPTYGYSVISFEVRTAAGGADLAARHPTTASSADTGRGAAFATDADSSTRWAVSRADRPRADSWLAVDLGAPTAVGQVTIDWEAAAGRAYVVQTSDDGSSWTTRAPYPRMLRSSRWVGIDDRVGFLVRGGSNPIEVGDSILTLSAGPAAGSAGIVVEGLPEVRSADLARLADAADASAPRPSAPGVTASLAGGLLSVVNLTGDAVDTDVAMAADGPVPCFEGTQEVSADGTVLHASVAAASGVVLAPRASVSVVGGGRPPSGLVVTVDDAVTLRLKGIDAQVDVVFADGQRRRATVSRARTATVRVGGRAYPLDDLALARQTFPTSPLPPTMTSPAAAVDGSDSTAWAVTGSGRMVVDLGEARALGKAVVDWGTAPGFGTVEVSDDGLGFRRVGRIGPGTQLGSLALGTTARYVGLAVESPGSSGRRVTVVSLTVTGG